VRVLCLTLCVFALAGCGRGGSSSAPKNTAPADTHVDPGPNPTSGDPGPNNTANGPLTLQGTLVARSSCTQLKGAAAQEPVGKYQLEFDVEKVRRSGANIVLSGPDGDRTVGPNDTIYVAGVRGTGSGPCGQIFRVEKVVAVTPAN
jgi:hypothetical protein